MLLAILAAVLALQSEGAARARIEEVVATHYPLHPDRPALANRLWTAWRRLPAHLSERGLEQIAGNSSGMLTPMKQVDAYRGRIAEHPVYEQLVLPESYYHRLYDAAERFIVAELAGAAAFRPLDAAQRRTLESQFEHLMAVTKQALEARIGGEGGHALVKQLVDEKRAAFVADIDLPLGPFHRPLTDPEIAEVVETVTSSAARLDAIVLTEYTPGRQPGPWAYLPEGSTQDPGGTALLKAQTAASNVLGSLQRIRAILRPETEKARADRRQTLAEARSHLREAEERNRQALNEIRKAELLGMAGKRRRSGDAQRRGQGATENTSANSHAASVPATPVHGDPAPAPPKVTRRQQVYWLVCGGAALLIALFILRRRVQPAA